LLERCQRVDDGLERGATTLVYHDIMIPLKMSDVMIPALFP
jgi:hypothetical protein